MGFDNAVGRWVFYDIPNENVILLEDPYQQPTEEEMKKNIIKMPYEQAKMIRHAKDLPMPFFAPPVVVVDKEGKIVHESK